MFVALINIIKVMSLKGLRQTYPTVLSKPRSVRSTATLHEHNCSPSEIKKSSVSKHCYLSAAVSGPE